MQYGQAAHELRKGHTSSATGHSEHMGRTESSKAGTRKKETGKGERRRIGSGCGQIRMGRGRGEKGRMGGKRERRKGMRRVIIDEHE